MDEPEVSQPRTGLLLPDFDDISREWQAKVEALSALLIEQSTVWQEKMDRLTGLVEELLAEVRSIQGVTVTINREPPA